MSFGSYFQSKAKGGGTEVQRWCGKLGHLAARHEDEEKEHPVSKGKRANGMVKDRGNRARRNSIWKGEGNWCGPRKGAYWFDQAKYSFSDGDRAWAFPQGATTD